LKFGQIQRQIFFAYAVERANDSALEQRPERINVLRVKPVTYVLALDVANCLMRIGRRQKPIATVFICGYKRDLFRDRFANKTVQRSRIGVSIIWQITLPLREIAPITGILSAVPPPLNLSLAWAIFAFAADVSLIHFDDAHQLRELRIAHRSAKPMAHVPSCVKRRSFAEKHSAKLARRDTFFALKDRVKDLKPRHQRMLRILEDRSNEKREAIAVTASTLRIRALPTPRERLERVYGLALAATRAMDDAIRPAALKEEFPTSILIGKLRHQLLKRHHG
jgi:hypothetical protein